MNLADKTIINILAKSGEAVLLLISSIVMVRYLTKEEYGTFLQIMLIMNTAIMFTYFGIPQSIYYFFHKTDDRVLFTIRNIVIALILGMIAALGVFALSGHLAGWFHNPLFEKYKYIAVALVFLRGPIIMRDPLLVSQGNLLVNSVAIVLSNGLFYVPMIVVAFLSVGLSTILNVLLGASLVDFACFFFLMGWFCKQVKKEDDSSSDDVRKVSLYEQLRYALPIGISSYVGIIGRQIDQYIVSIFFSPRSFAVYSRGAMRVPALSTIQYTVNDIMMPYYVKDFLAGNIDSLLKNFHLCVEKVAKINFPVFVFLFIASPLLISLLYTEQYIGAVPIFRAYLFLLVINITTYGIIPRASGQTKSIFYASILNVVANIILSCLLVPVLGAVGAAIATIFCALLTSYYYLFISCRILKVGIKNIFPWKFLTSYLGVSILAGLPIIGVDYFCGLFEVHLLFVLAIECIVYLFGLIFLVMRFDLLTIDDLNTISKWLKIDADKWFKLVALIR